MSASIKVMGVGHNKLSLKGVNPLSEQELTT